MIIIDYKDRRPIYEQIVERFENLILKGVLEPQSQIPSVRGLAMELSINPNTIQKAYAELERKGLIYTVKGRGSFVGENDHFIDAKKLEILESIQFLVKDALGIGLKKDDLIKFVNQVCEEGENHD